MSGGTRLVDSIKLVTALGPQTPASAAPPYVSLKDYNHLTVVITYENGASGVAGAAIALHQAQDVAGTGAKTLAFVDSWVDADALAGDTLTYAAVGSNTLTLDATASKAGKVILEVNATDLDVANRFTAIGVTVGNATAQVVSIEYLLSGARYPGNVAQLPSALVN